MPDDAARNRTLMIRGTPVPRLGFGTWQLRGRDARDGVRDALEIGFRHIDTARSYGNEREVGQGIRDSGLQREDVFLVTKIPPPDFDPDRLLAAADDSLRRLDTDYADLLLLHWPNPRVPLHETLAAMNELRAAGRIRHAGVSNFGPDLLHEALQHTPVFADQVEFHPFLRQDALVQMAPEHDLTITAYSPLAQGRVARDATLQEIGASHGKSAGQVALRWLLDQPHTTVIPKAARHERRVENFDVWDFELTDDERGRIAALA